MSEGITGQELIDDGIRFYLDIGGASQQDAELRARCEHHANVRAQMFYRFRPWWWRYQTNTVNVGSGGFGDLPLDYGSMRAIGGVHHETLKYPLDWLPPTKLIALRRTSSVQSDRPLYWCVAGDDGEENRRLQVHPPPATNVTIRLDYERSTPLIVDSAFPSGMERFPGDYHLTVLWVGLRASLMFDAGDARADGEERAFIRGMIDAWKEEQQAGHEHRQAGDEYGAPMWRP